MVLPSRRCSSRFEAAGVRIFRPEKPMRWIGPLPAQDDRVSTSECSLGVSGPCRFGGARLQNPTSAMSREGPRQKNPPARRPGPKAERRFVFAPQDSADRRGWPAGFLSRGEAGRHLAFRWRGKSLCRKIAADFPTRKDLQRRERRKGTREKNGRIFGFLLCN